VVTKFLVMQHVASVENRPATPSHKKGQSTNHGCNAKIYMQNIWTLGKMFINVEQDFLGNKSIVESGFLEARSCLIYNQSTLNATLNATVSSIPICPTFVIHVAGKLLMKERCR
jgi:hypothetical protein